MLLASRYLAISRVVEGAYMDVWSLLSRFAGLLMAEPMVLEDY